MLDRCLIWDFDGTLAFRDGAWTGSVCEVLKNARPDLAIDRERIRPLMRAGFPWHSPELVRAPCSADAWWEDLYPVLENALVVGGGLEHIEARAIARGVRAEYTDARAWRVYEDVVPALQELSDRGWHHLMLSNHVPELARLVADLGLHPYFRAIYCSADMGIEKPNPAAFERVLADYPAARTGWMIGDSWAADVEGARRVGMRSILVRQRHPDALLRCETLAQIIPIVSGLT